MQTLPEYLKARAKSALRGLLKEAEAVTADEALRDRHPHWPDQPWGIGQDGSIAGIVYHVAAWKTLTLRLFLPDGQALNREDFDPSAAPAQDDWPGILAWLKRIGTDWDAALNGLQNDAFASQRDWAGTTITLADFITEMIQHDVQHAAQIEYLRQRRLSEEKGA